VKDKPEKAEKKKRGKKSRKPPPPKKGKPKKQSDATKGKRGLKKYAKQTRDFGNVKSVFEQRLVEQGIHTAFKTAIDATRV
jgi:hypothetical protein